MKTNRKIVTQDVYTHNGAKAARNPTTMAELKRSCLAALLFEDMFYESGNAHAERVRELIPQCDPVEVGNLAIRAREEQHLRHLPLYLVACLGTHPEIENYRGVVGYLLSRVIQRPDELTEFCAIYWKLSGRKANTRRKKAIPIAFRRGMAKAFNKFNAYSLGKYRGEGNEIKLVDALRMVRPKPHNAEQALNYKLLREGTLPTPDTWETELSSGADKKATFTRLLLENKLGGLAFLRNLRNMEQAGVPIKVIREAMAKHKFERVLPFRFVSAANHAPSLVNELSAAMERVLGSESPTLMGKTAIVVDVSGSMDATLSGKSEVRRTDAAAGLALLALSKCEQADVYTFSDKVVQVKPFKSLALIDAIKDSQFHSGTFLGRALKQITQNKVYNRIIVVTDEQSSDPMPRIVGDRGGYIVNIGTYQNGVGGNNGWHTISGWSERTLDYIEAIERD